MTLSCSVTSACAQHRDSPLAIRVFCMTRNYHELHNYQADEQLGWQCRGAEGGTSEVHSVAVSTGAGGGCSAPLVTGKAVGMMKTAVMKTTQPTAIQPITRPTLPRWKGPGWNCLLLRRRMAMGMASACPGRIPSAQYSQQRPA